jgi:hypothetical protein
VRSRIARSIATSNSLIRSLPLANLADDCRVKPPTFGSAPYVRILLSTILVFVRSYNIRIKRKSLRQQIIVITAAQVKDRRSYGKKRPTKYRQTESDHRIGNFYDPRTEITGVPTTPGVPADQITGVPSATREPRAKSRVPRATSQAPRAKSQEPGAKSQVQRPEPSAKSPEPSAKSPEPSAKSNARFYTSAVTSILCNGNKSTDDNWIEVQPQQHCRGQHSPLILIVNGTCIMRGHSTGGLPPTGHFPIVNNARFHTFEVNSILCNQNKKTKRTRLSLVPKGNHRSVL